jgi:hypothetical protein
MKGSRRTWTLALALGTLACSSPFPCTRYCWSHQQVVADVTSQTMPGVPDGRFDATCWKLTNLEPWHPPLPPFGWYAAEQCVAADVHEVIARTVAAIQDPTIDATQACDVTDLQVYADLVQTLVQQARDACVAHLSCNGAPAGCDIDPTTAEEEACTVPTAESLCDQVVLAPALAALSDLTNGPGAAQPQRDGTVIEYVDDPATCQPILQADTDDTPACDEGGGGGSTGLDESGGVDGSSGGSMSGVFGDIDVLVRCSEANTSTTCTVEPLLFVNVQSNFGIFHDEGIRFFPIETVGIGRGVQISGTERRGDGAELLLALGLRDGDVITHVDGAAIFSPGAMERVLLAVPSTTAWKLVIHRKREAEWEERGLVIVRG